MHIISAIVNFNWSHAIALQKLSNERSYKIRCLLCFYALLPVVTSLEGKSLSNQFVVSHFIFVSNPRIPCYIWILGLLRVVTCCYVLLRVVTCCYVLLRAVTCCYVLLRVVTCCYALLPVATSLEGKSLTSLHVPFIYSFPALQYLVTQVHWTCYVLLRVVTCSYNFKVCQISLHVPILYSFTTNEYLVAYVPQACYMFLRFLPVVTTLEGNIQSNYFPGFHSLFVPTHEYLFTYVHWVCYVFLRVVTRCYMLLHLQREKVCQNSFQVPILYSFPTHEYLAAYVHWVVTCCYVLLRVVTFYYIFRGEKFVKLVSRFPFTIRFQPANALLHKFIGLVTCCNALLPVVTSLKVCQISFKVPILYQFPTKRIPCCISSLGLLRVVTPCYLSLHLQMGIFSQISSQVPILYSFQPTNTLLYMFIWFVTCCYALLQVVTSLEGISLSKYFPCSTLIFVSNPPIPCCIYVHQTLYVLLRVVTCCYIFRGEMFVKIDSRFPFCIRFQPTNTLLHMSIGLVTCCYGLLRVVTCYYILRGKKFAKLVSRSPFYIRFQPTNTLLHMFIRLLRIVTCCYELLHFITSLEGTHEYLVAYVPWACYVLLRLVTCCYIFRGETFLKLDSRFPFYIRFQPTNTFLHMSIGLVTCCLRLLRVVTCYYIFRRKKIVKLDSRFPFYIRFQPTNTLLHMFIRLLRVVTCCYALLHFITYLEGKSL